VLLFSCLVPERPKAMIDWKKIRKRAETAALLSIMTAGYLAPGLIWSATDRTLQLSRRSCEEAIASDDEDNEVIDCYHLKRLRVLAPDRTSASGGEIWTSNRDFADTLFQIDERSKFRTQKGLIFGLV
jgi:hypothetical protein